MNEIKRILVLTSKTPSSSRRFFEQVAGIKKWHIDVCSYAELQVNILGNELRIVRRETGTDIADYDLIVFKTYQAKAEFAASVAEYAKSRNIPYVDSEVGAYHSLTKLTENVRFALAGIAVPDTIAVCIESLDEVYHSAVQMLGDRFVIKDPGAQRGEMNFLVDSLESYRNATAKLKTGEGDYVLLQQFIDNDGDYRLLVFNSQIPLAFKRTAGDASHLNNTSKGGMAAKVEVSELPMQLTDMAISSAAALGRESAGVDIIQDRQTGKWFVLEANNAPQVASGAYLDEKKIVYAEYLDSLMNH